MGMLKNRLILTAMMLALPLAGWFFGLLTEHNFNTLPYYTVDGPMEGKPSTPNASGTLTSSTTLESRFPATNCAARCGSRRFTAPMHRTWHR